MFKSCRLTILFRSQIPADATVPTERVQADYAEKESGVNSMAFVERKPNGEAEGVMLLATGGEDGVLRVWKLRADAPSEFECYVGPM